MSDLGRSQGSFLTWINILHTNSSDMISAEKRNSRVQRVQAPHHIVHPDVPCLFKAIRECVICEKERENGGYPTEPYEVMMLFVSLDGKMPSPFHFSDLYY